MNPFKLPALSSKAKWLCVAAGMAASGSAMSTTLFADSFQSGLGQWNAGSSAVIVADPVVLGGSALAFTRPTGGGDLYSTNTFSSSTNGQFILSFDYLGLGDGRGYVGMNNPGETWLAGDGTWPSTVKMTHTGQWEHVSLSFTSASAIQLKLEQWNENPVPLQAYFKNLVLTDANGVTAVPEPSSAALLMAGMLGLGLVRRRQAKG